MSRSFWFAAFAFAVNMLGTTLPTPLYPFYQLAYGFDPLTITVIFAIYAVGVVAALIAFGRLSDALGRRPVLLAGLALSLLSALLLGLVHDVAAIFAARIVSGLSAGIFAGCGTAYVVELAGPARRALGSAIAVAANIGGLGLGTLLSGSLAQYAPQPLVLSYLVDAALVLLALGALAFVDETVPRSAEVRWTIQRLRVPPEVRSIFVRAAIAGICSFAVAGVFSAVAPSFLARVIGEHNRLYAGLLVFAMMGMTAAGQLTLARFADAGRALVAGTGILIVGILILALGIGLRSEVLLFISAIVEGYGQGLGIGAGLGEINARLTAARGETTSAYFVFIYLGLALPVVGVGLLAEFLGLATAGLIFCGIIALALGGNMLLLLRPQGSGASR